MQLTTLENRSYYSIKRINYCYRIIQSESLEQKTEKSQKQNKYNFEIVDGLFLSFFHRKDHRVFFLKLRINLKSS